MQELEYSPMASPTGMYVAMARYQALFGLKPIGPHQPLADELLRDTTQTCAACGGTGLAGTHGGVGWWACPECHGLGAVCRLAPEELQARRQRVLNHYPDAAPRDWRPGRSLRLPALDLATGEMVDLERDAAEAPEQLELAF